MLLVCVCVCMRAQTEQLSGVVDGLRKKKNERKRKKKMQDVLFAMQRQISLSLAFALSVLPLFFLHTSRRAMVAAGRCLSIYIWKERACLNRHAERESELASIQHAYLSISRLHVLFFSLSRSLFRT